MTDDHIGEQLSGTAGSPTRDGAAVLECIRGLPGGPELLAAAEKHGGCVELVGELCATSCSVALRASSM